MTDAPTDRSPRDVGWNRKAAWTLVVLAPASAEATYSGVTMPYVWPLLPALVVMYGSGILLLRELVVRFHGGLPSLLLAGLVYELLEDGIGLQALTSPNLYDAADWGPRVLGFNTTYWESQIGYHTVFSLLIPVLLTDLLFPAHRGRPYIGRGGLAVAAAGTVAGIALLRVLITNTQDPGYQAPLPILVGILAAIALLLFLALRVLPARPPVRSEPNGRRAPRPVTGALMAGAASAGFLALLLPPGLLPGWLESGWDAWAGFVPMAAAAALAAGAGRLTYRWSSTPGWSPGHWTWLAGGALIGRTLYTVVTAPAVKNYALIPSVIAITIGTVIIAGMTYLLARLHQQIKHRTAGQPTEPEPTA